MQEVVFQIDNQLASRLSMVASEQYHGDQNAVISDALLQFFFAASAAGPPRIGAFDLRNP